MALAQIHSTLISQQQKKNKKVTFVEDLEVIFGLD